MYTFNYEKEEVYLEPANPLMAIYVPFGDLKDYVKEYSQELYNACLEADVDEGDGEYREVKYFDFHALEQNAECYDNRFWWFLYNDLKETHHHHLNG